MIALNCRIWLHWTVNMVCIGWYIGCLHWIALDWIALDCIGLHWIGLHWIALNKGCLHWIALTLNVVWMFAWDACIECGLNARTGRADTGYQWNILVLTPRHIYWCWHIYILVLICIYWYWYIYWCWHLDIDWLHWTAEYWLVASNCKYGLHWFIFSFETASYRNIEYWNWILDPDIGGKVNGIELLINAGLIW